MYAKCGALAKAKQVLEALPVRDVVTWSSLIAGYLQQGQGEEALKCFDSMQCEGHSPDEVTFACALKGCGDIGAIAKGKQIHDKIVSLGMLEKNVVLGSTLVGMYAKCHALTKAQEVLEGLPIQNIVTWNALIAAFVQQGQGDEALICFDGMHLKGQSPDAVTFTCALKAYGITKAAGKGEQIHAKIVSLCLLEKDIVLGTSLVDMYAKRGALAKAKQVLEGLPVRDAVMWSSLIAGYAKQEQGEQALKCYDRMQREGHLPDAVTFNCALKACGNVRAATRGEQIHDKIVSLGMLKDNIELGNTLVDMYAKCGLLVKAQKVLEGLPVRNVVSWNALIAGHVQQGQGEEVLKCFDGMQREGHTPDAVAFMCALKACGIVGAAAKAEQIHDKISSLSMLEKNIALGGTLVDMYARCGALAKAHRVLEGLPVRDVIIWNALITGYAQQGQRKEVLKCFDSMQTEGLYPDAVSCTCALKACENIGAATKGEQIHDKIVTLAMLEKDIVLGSALVGMYDRCGAPAKAQQVLETLPVQNGVMWNAVLAGYTQHGQGEEALKCYDSMQCKGHSLNAVTYNSALKACGIIGAAAKGEQIHLKIVCLGLLEKNIELGNALIDMYVKCALLAKAVEVFKELPVKNLVTWNLLIGGYAQHGKSWEASNCFQRMLFNGVKPDSITKIFLLNACCHSGLWIRVK